MAKTKELSFTAASIAGLPPAAPGSRDYYRDTNKKSEGLRLSLSVTDKGAKSFFIQRRIGGRPVRMTIGRVEDVSLAQARRKAAALHREVAAGNDPYSVAQDVKHCPTFGAFFAEEYLERYAKPHKKTWKQDADLYRLHLEQLKNLKLSAITRRDVQRLHVQIGETAGKRTANLAAGLVRSVFKRAMEWGYHAGSNPGEGIRKFPERSRERFLKPEEVPQFFAALATDAEATGTTLWRDFFMLALFTGARRGNLMRMRWDDLDLGRAVWTIPGDTTKTGQTYVLALPRVAVDLLRSRKAQAEAAHAEALQKAARRGEEKPKASPWVFPGRDPERHMVEPKAAWQRIRAAAGLPDLRIHDLRRTLGSWQAAAGASLPIIGRSLGHANATSTAVYARLDLDPVRESVERATDALVQAGGLLVEPEETER